jgi:DNA-binding transcriptional ArsR family regulator
VARSSAENRARTRSDPAPAEGAPEAVHPASASRDLDRLIHERVRLGIVSALAANESLSFTELRSLMRVTDGNLSVHARRLEVAGYVACEKSFDGRIPRTTYRLTAEGRSALERYLGHMEALLRVMRER